MSGVVFVNPHSGGGNEVSEFEELFAGHEVVECEPRELAAHIRATLDAKPSFVGVAGGDGSIRCAAEVLLAAQGDTPLLAVPGGTRNHFARDLGIEDFDTAASIADAGTTHLIDVGTVNDAVFVNNSSVGVYPRLVAHREARESDMPKRLAAIVAAWHQLRRGHKLRVTVDGVPEKVWAVFVGNNCYGDSLRDLAGRDRLDEGVLDVRVARAGPRFSRLRIAAAVLFGRVERSPLIERRTSTAVTIDVAGPRVPVALDGEVVEMKAPLRYAIEPRALPVLVSAEHP